MNYVEIKWLCVKNEAEDLNRKKNYMEVQTFTIDHTWSCIATTENYYVFTHINCNGRMSKNVYYYFRLEVSIPVNETLSVCNVFLSSDSSNNVVGPSPLAMPQYFGTPNYNFKATWDMQNIGNFGSFSEQLKLKSNEILIKFFFNLYCEIFPSVGIKET